MVKWKSIGRLGAVLGVACVVLGVAAGGAGCNGGWHSAAGAPTTFTLWQLPNQTPSQMMSYVIRSVHGKIIVIDGGTKGDTAYLKAFLHDQGNRVDAWFITHPHDDHCSALCEIMRNPEGLALGPIYASMPDAAWLDLVTSDLSEKRTLSDFVAAVEQTHRELIDVALGKEFRIDGIRIEVLGIRNPEIRQNPLNNSCMVLRVSDRCKSVLFLADLGVEGGEKLLHSRYADRLASDYVQMAHHGQKGVSEAVYQAVHPRYCLWPTPRWLWDNDSGKGVGSGKWKTLEVRAWMEPFAIQRHYCLFDGLQRID